MEKNCRKLKFSGKLKEGALIPKPIFSYFSLAWLFGNSRWPPNKMAARRHLAAILNYQKAKPGTRRKKLVLESGHLPSSSLKISAFYNFFPFHYWKYSNALGLHSHKLRSWKFTKRLSILSLTHVPPSLRNPPPAHSSHPHPPPPGPHGCQEEIHINKISCYGRTGHFPCVNASRTEKVAQIEKRVLAVAARVWSERTANSINLYMNEKVIK